LCDEVFEVDGGGEVETSAEGGVAEVCSGGAFGGDGEEGEKAEFEGLCVAELW